MSDIVRRKESITQDFEKKTLNGFIGIFIHIIVLGFVNLLLMILMGVGGALGGLAFLITVFTGPLWLVYWNSYICLLYTSPSPRDLSTSRMPSSA